MDRAQTDVPTARKPLRLWPGVVIVILQWLGRFVVPVFVPGAVFVGLIGGLVGGLAVLVWWVFFSRAPWAERLGALVLIAIALFATPLILDKSIATGAMGMLFPIFAIPGITLAFVAWAVASRRLSGGPRWASMAAAILLAAAAWALVRTGGFTADFHNDFACRWVPTPQQRLLARSGDEPTGVPAPLPSALPSAPAPAATPGEPPRGKASHEPTTPSPTPAARETGGDWPG